MNKVGGTCPQALSNSSPPAHQRMLVVLPGTKDSSSCGMCSNQKSRMSLRHSGVNTVEMSVAMLLCDVVVRAEVVEY